MILFSQHNWLASRTVNKFFGKCTENESHLDAELSILLKVNWEPLC